MARKLISFLALYTHTHLHTQPHTHRYTHIYIGLALGGCVWSKWFIINFNEQRWNILMVMNLTSDKLEISYNFYNFN